MTDRVNGSGTIFYGRRATGGDGSYITTKWVCAVWVPIYPLASYRVDASGNAEQIPLDKRQVRIAYGIAVAILAVAVGPCVIALFISPSF